MNPNQRPPVIVVAGLGRCGSSMTMAMLAAGGVPCVGTAPDYEDPAFHRFRRIAAQLYFQARGHAVKILDPHKNLLPVPAYPGQGHVVIWLDRNPTEQAKSQIKLALSTGILKDYHVASEDRVKLLRRNWRAQLQRDRQACSHALRGATILQVRFESVLLTPRIEAERIARFVGPYLGLDLDIAAMDAVVRRRSPECAGDLAIEQDLVAHSTAVTPG